MAAAVVLFLAIAGLSWRLLGQGSRVAYTTSPVTTGPITRTVSATGTVNPQLTIIVGTYVSGVIQEVSCDYNTVVKKGQACAKIDPRPYQAEYDRTVADLKRYNTALDLARIESERVQRLRESGAVSQEELD